MKFLRPGAIVLLLLAIVLPFVPLVLWSFSAKWFYPQVLPGAWGLRAWEYVFGIAGMQVVTALSQSVIIALITTTISLLIGIPAGRVLGIYHFPGKHLILFLFTLPVIVPALSTTMGLHLWFLRLGLTDSLKGSATRLRVEIHGQSWCVLSNYPGFSIGQSVCLHVPPEKIHIFPGGSSA